MKQTGAFTLAIFVVAQGEWQIKQQWRNKLSRNKQVKHNKFQEPFFDDIWSDTNGKNNYVTKFGYEWMASWQEYRFVIEGRDNVILCSDIRWSNLLCQYFSFGDIEGSKEYTLLDIWREIKGKNIDITKFGYE